MQQNIKEIKERSPDNTSWEDMQTYFYRPDDIHVYTLYIVLLEPDTTCKFVEMWLK